MSKRRHSRQYPAKILLFGEYAVILGSEALAIPFRKFRGCWSGHISENFRRALQSYGFSFSDFAEYLRELSASGELQITLDTGRLEKDLDEDCHFDSDIPPGSGLGSSGALCAAVYERYGLQPEGKEPSLRELKADLAAMEGYFHGKSSGLDPLVSYLDRAIRIRHDHMEEVAFPEVFQTCRVFLLNSHQMRKTGSLVNGFIQEAQKPDFREKLEKELIPLNRMAIDSYLLKEEASLWGTFKKISSFQTQFMRPMIPENWLDAFRQGLETDEYYLKICGAGGGGFMLGICRHLEKLTTYFCKEDIIPVTDTNLF